MQVWFEHEGGYDLVNSVADIPDTAMGYYIENENGDIIDVSGSCDWMLDQNIYDIIWESEVCF